MNNTQREQLEKDRELLKDWNMSFLDMAIKAQAGELPPYKDRQGYLNVSIEDFVRCVIEAQQRVTQAEERVAERMRCVEIISKQMLETKDIVPFLALEKAQKTILNQNDE